MGWLAVAKINHRADDFIVIWATVIYHLNLRECRRLHSSLTMHRHAQTLFFNNVRADNVAKPADHQEAQGQRRRVALSDAIIISTTSIKRINVISCIDDKS